MKKSALLVLGIGVVAVALVLLFSLRNSLMERWYIHRFHTYSIREQDEVIAWISENANVSAQAVGFLIRQFGKSDGRDALVSTALRRVIERQAGNALHFLERLLSAPEADVRKWAIIQIGFLFSAGRPIAGSLRDAFGLEPNEELKESILEALIMVEGEKEFVTETLIQWLDGGNVALQRFAAAHLCWPGVESEKARDSLLRASKHQDVDVRESATAALSGIGVSLESFNVEQDARTTPGPESIDIPSVR